MNYTILTPRYYLEGQVYKLPDGTRDENMEVFLETVELWDGVTVLRSTWTNVSEVAYDCQVEVRVCAEFSYTHYVIPGIIYNGNGWGKGLEPKGLSVDGEPWIFDYRRTTIPSCTISENAEQYLAVMASDTDADSLQSSCSMIALEDGRMVHRILYPCMEKPKTYCNRDQYSAGYDSYITLRPGESFIASAYILYGKPVAENYAAANVQDVALELLGDIYEPRFTTSEIQELALHYAEGKLTNFNDRPLFRIGHILRDGKYQPAEGFELGWCGQNALYSRLMIQYGKQRGIPGWVKIGAQNLNAWTQEAMGKAGLIHTHYDWWFYNKTNMEDTCNLGYAIMELIRAWRLYPSQGHWFDAARSVGDFMVAHYSEEYGFGKTWNVETGELGDPAGTIGAYIIPGLVMLYQETKENAYLETAKKACRFYYERDLKYFMTTAGALDTYCIDKETSGPMLVGALMLYEQEPCEEWLDIAKKAGWYFTSWMMHHDIITDAEHDFAKYGYRTLGGTTVSTQHHHIDPWGAFVVPEYVKLWKITGDENWHARAKMLWASAIQNIAPEEGKWVHGHFRDAGTQNEAYFHCRWGFEEGLEINEWLVAWPQAFCWKTAVEVADADLR